MERMGDILARTAGQRARQTRPADGNTPASGAAPAHPTVPLPTRAATGPLSTTRSGWRGRGVPATAASSTRRLTPRPLPPRAGSSGPPRAAPTPAPQADALEAPSPRGVAAVPASAPRPTPADAGGDTLPGDRILELPPRRLAPAARVTGQPPRARVTSPLSATPPPVGAPAANTPSGSGSRMPDANPHRASVRPPVTHLREDNAGYVTSGATVAAGAARISIDPHVCPICGGAGYVRLDVPLGDPAFGKPVACVCKERQIEERRRSDLRRMSSLDPFLEKTFDAFDTAVQGAREAFEAARTFAADPNGWIVLSGTHGVGKTHLAAAIANMQLAQGTLVFFSIVPDLLDHLRAAFAPSSEVTYDEMFDKVREAGLLVLDDLGAENSTAWATEKLFQLINYRYNFRMPTVITTNTRLLSQMDERIRSRLSDIGLVRHVPIKAQDYRERHVDRRPRNGGTPRSGGGPPARR